MVYPIAAQVQPGARQTAALTASATTTTTAAAANIRHQYNTL